MSTVFQQSFIETRLNVKSIIEQDRSPLKMPFYTNCFLIPSSKVATYLKGDYKLYTFYPIEKKNYSTKCAGEFLEGMTTFYAQPQSEANAGIVVYEDQFSLDNTNLSNKTDFENAPETNRLEAMSKVRDAIGRNAIAICVTETNVKKYNMVMDNFRQIDTSISYLKIKVRNSLTAKATDISAFLNDYQSYGGTILMLNENKAMTDADTMPLKNRPDFIVGAVGLNPYVSKENTSYVVGLNFDGLNINLPVANASMDANSAMLAEMIKKGLSYIQVRADDDSEFVLAGCSVFYQGKALPANMFLLAKYAEYLLKTNLLDAITDANGVANVSAYRNAVSGVLVVLEPYKGFLLNTVTSKPLDQTTINQSVKEKTLVLDRVISMVTLPTTFFTEASISVYVQ